MEGDMFGASSIVPSHVIKEFDRTFCPRGAVCETSPDLWDSSFCLQDMTDLNAILYTHIQYKGQRVYIQYLTCTGLETE